jgi:hypothetical protein
MTRRGETALPALLSGMSQEEYGRAAETLGESASKLVSAH